MLSPIGVGAEMIVLLDLKQRLAAYGPTFLPGRKLPTVVPKGVKFEHVESVLSVFVPADTVILPWACTREAHSWTTSRLFSRTRAS
jgi:hypothetical protein